jgi:hypothetical protein
LSSHVQVAMRCTSKQTRKVYDVFYFTDKIMWCSLAFFLLR